ncbi:MAG: phosphatidylserine synthase [Firmicutes bacterium]|nr:phosphatidylserine synthase [Bacillota bacterium]NBI64699.1 phosphatidylserine synthase [Clostridiales bacterium]
MEKQKKLLGYYNYTVILTYIGLLMGIAGIAFVMGEKYQQAIICLMICGCCDMFDGAVASTKQRSQREKSFGVQIDSLSDLVCFGVLPGFFTYSITGYRNLGLCVCCGYILCALIRLSYFNVLEGERQWQDSGPRKWYIGLPVTAIALLLPACFVIQQAWQPERTGMFMGLLFIAAIAFVVPIRIKKPQLAGKLGFAAVGATEFIALTTGMGLGV